MKKKLFPISGYVLAAIHLSAFCVEANVDKKTHFYLMPYPIFEDGLRGDHLVFIGQDKLQLPQDFRHWRSKREGENFI